MRAFRPCPSSQPQGGERDRRVERRRLSQRQRRSRGPGNSHAWALGPPANGAKVAAERSRGDCEGPRAPRPHRRLGSGSPRGTRGPPPRCGQRGLRGGPPAASRPCSVPPAPASSAVAVFGLAPALPAASDVHPLAPTASSGPPILTPCPAGHASCRPPSARGRQCPLPRLPQTPECSYHVSCHVASELLAFAHPPRARLPRPGAA